MACFGNCDTNYAMQTYNIHQVDVTHNGTRKKNTDKTITFVNHTHPNAA